MKTLKNQIVCIVELAEDDIDASEQSCSTAADLAGLMQVEAFF